MAVMGNETRQPDERTLEEANKGMGICLLLGACSRGAVFGRRVTDGRPAGSIFHYLFDMNISFDTL